MNKEYYSLDPRRRILTRYTASDDGKSQVVHEFIGKEEYDELAKQLEYVNKKIENRDALIEELRREPDKTKALKGTIRGLEKTRDKLQARVNRLAKKLVKAEQRASKETVPLRPTLIIRCCQPYAITYEENIIIDGYAYDITRIEYLDNCSCKIYLMLNPLKTLNRRNNI